VWLLLSAVGHFTDSCEKNNKVQMPQILHLLLRQLLQLPAATCSYLPLPAAICSYLQPRQLLLLLLTRTNIEIALQNSFQPMP
jgi:hypothetical protein